MRVLVVHPMWYFIGPAQRRALFDSSASYAANHARLMALRPGLSDAYVDNLRCLGHVSELVVYGSDQLQAQWAQEHGLRLPFHERKQLQPRLRRGVVPWLSLRDRPEWHRRVLAEQIAAFQPDVIFTYTLFMLPVAWLRSISRGARLAAWVGTERVPDLATLRGYDLLLTLAPQYLPLMHARGLNAAYLPAAFDDRLLREAPPASPADRDLAVSFVGSYGAEWGQAFTDTEYVAEQTGMACYGGSVAGLRRDSPLVRHYRGACWGTEMFRIYGRSRVVFNRHTDVPLDVDGALHDPAQVVRFDHAGNMRLFEATGMGALMVTERSWNLADLFEPGREVVAYDDARQAVDCIRYYLAHADERQAIAAAGQARTLAEHTYYQRAQRLVSILEEYA